MAPHICFLLERGNPPRRNLVIEETIAHLQQRGATVTSLYPEETLLRLDTLRAEADLYLLKSNTDLALSLATVLEAIGARVLNTCVASGLAKNKVVAAARLLAAGLPSPRSLATAHPAQLAPQVAAQPTGGLILKPHRGHYGLGIAVAARPTDLPDAFADHEVVFAQEYLSQARTDLKVFGIGDRVFAVRKTFNAGDSFARSGAPTLLPPPVEDIARRTGRAFGLELFGLDLAESPDGRVDIVDVNAFPGYRGVPDGARHLADYIHARAAG